RQQMVQSVFAGLAKVPPGPMPLLWATWDSTLRVLPFDSAAAGRLLGARGWRDHDGDGVRDKDGQKLAFELLTPTTSVIRRQYARLLQEQFRRRSEEHTSELQSRGHLVCRLLLEKQNGGWGGARQLRRRGNRARLQRRRSGIDHYHAA